MYLQTGRPGWGENVTIGYAEDASLDPVSSDADRKQNGIQCVRGSDLKLRISTKALK